MTPGRTTTRDDLERTLRRLRSCLSFWRRALLVFVLTSLATVPYAMTRPRSYRSETVVLYQERIRTADITGAGSEGPAESTRRLGARLREALLSRASLEPIVLDLHLYARVAEERGLIDAVDEMRKHITFRTREGDTFEIAFEGDSPDEVLEVTQRLAECIVKESATRRADQARTLKEFVDAESERNKLELRTNEAALASFLALHPELKRIPGTEERAPVAAATEGLSLAALEQRAARLEAQLNDASRAPAGAAAPTPASPPASEPAPKPTEPVPDSAELVAARKDLADKLGKFTEKHPDVLASKNRLRAAEAAQSAHAAQAAQAAHTAQANRDVTPAPAATGEPAPHALPLKDQLAIVRAQIAARRASASASASASANASTNASAPVDADAGATTASFAAARAATGPVALEVELHRLQREVSDTRERQRQLDEKQFKASITASSVMNDRNIQVSVLDPAYRPTHAVSRPRSTLVTAALLLCLLLALFTAVASAWLDDRIHARADLERLDIMPVFAVIPRSTVRALPRSTANG
jgi:uncharacterized protein involved in exopolysaccharide biosynthesis